MTNTVKRSYTVSAAAIAAAVTEVHQLCNGDHSRDCAWNQVMTIVENANETGDPEPELVENALALIDHACTC